MKINIENSNKINSKIINITSCEKPVSPYLTAYMYICTLSFSANKQNSKYNLQTYG